MKFAIHTVDENVYFAPSYSYEVEGLDPQVMFVTFVPTNGRRHGNPHKVPFGRITEIVELEGPSPRFSHDTMKEVWARAGEHSSGDARAWAFVNHVCSGIPFGPPAVDQEV